MVYKMAQPQRQKEKPAEPVVPQLAPEEVRRRSEPIFDAAASRIFVPKAANISSEVSDYLKILESKLKGISPTEANAERAYEQARAEYIKRNPNATLTHLLQEQDFDFRPNFDFNESGGRITSVKFDSSDVASFQKDAKSAASKLETAFAKFKKLVLDNMVKAAKPVETGKYDHFFVQRPDFLTEQQFSQFCGALQTGVKTKTPSVPIKVAYAEDFSPPKLKLEYGGKRKTGVIKAG